MRTPARTLVALVGLADATWGLVGLCWPGVLEELLHPGAMATTFRAQQWAGVVLLGRGIAGLAAALRPTPRRLGGLAALWAVTAPADALLAWQIGDESPVATLAHGGRAGFAVAWALLLHRLAQRPSTPSSETA